MDPETLTGADWWALAAERCGDAAVTRPDGSIELRCPYSRIAQVMGVGTSTVSRRVAACDTVRLVERGVLEIAPPNPTDPTPGVPTAPAGPVGGVEGALWAALLALVDAGDVDDPAAALIRDLAARTGGASRHVPGSSRDDTRAQLAGSAQPGQPDRTATGHLATRAGRAGTSQPGLGRTVSQVRALCSPISALVAARGLEPATSWEGVIAACAPLADAAVERLVETVVAKTRGGGVRSPFGLLVAIACDYLDTPATAPVAAVDDVGIGDAFTPGLPDPIGVEVHTTALETARDRLAGR